MTERIANALSFDVEDYFHVTALSQAIDRSDWDSITPRVADNTRRLLDLLAGHDVRATFFVLGWVAERFPALVRDIHAAGHEIACHGYSHSRVYTQSPVEFREETHRARALLEDACGERVLGYRAASYSITRRSLWALDVLLDEGFAYDSSVFPVRHDLYGIPDAPRFVHRMPAPSGRLLLEFPPSTCRLFGANLPAAGGGYFRLYPYALTRHLLRRLNLREHQPAMFYLHPWEVDPEQPRVNVSWLSRFRHYNNLDKCEQRLRRLLADFRFATAREVLAAGGWLDAAAGDARDPQSAAGPAAGATTASAAPPTAAAASRGP